MNGLPQWVPDWRDARHWYSIHASAIGIVFTAVSASLALTGAAAPWFSVFDFGVAMLIATAIFVASVIGRLVDQSARIAAHKARADSNAGKATQ